MPTASTGKRKHYTITFKLEVVGTAKFTSNAVAARTHGVDESMVRRWRRNEEALSASEANRTYRGGMRARLAGGGRPALFAALELRLFQWLVDERRKRSCGVSRRSIRRQAKLMHSEMSLAGPFEASAGWCNNFLERFKTQQSETAQHNLCPKESGRSVEEAKHTGHLAKQAALSGERSLIVVDLTDTAVDDWKQPVVVVHRDRARDHVTSVRKGALSDAESYSDAVTLVFHL